MADDSALAGLLERANQVFLLARGLGWGFQQDFQSRGSVHLSGDDPPHERHREKIDQFIAATLEMADAVKQPPDGFATIAEQLRVAGKLAKRLSNPNDSDILGMFPDLNSVAYDGYRAIEAADVVQSDDPFAAFDDPKPDESSEAFNVVPTWDEIYAKLHATREITRHPNATHNPNRMACDSYNDYAALVRMLEKVDIEGPPPPDYHFHPLQTMGYIMRALDDVELLINRKTGKTQTSPPDQAAHQPSHEASSFYNKEALLATMPHYAEVFSKGAKPWKRSKRRPIDKNTKSMSMHRAQDPIQTKRSTDGESNGVKVGTASKEEKPKPFIGGIMMFYTDRVELCGVNICSGPRSRTRRKILDLLCERRPDGTFVAYSGDQLAAELKADLGRGTVAGVIRDLRDDISNALRSKANILCGQRDVILSGGVGYRLADCVNVRLDGSAEPNAVTELGSLNNEDTRPHDLPDEQAIVRQTWILGQLAIGMKLKSPDVAQHFSCSAKTAQRDLASLKEAGTIEFVGAPRTGYYQLSTAASDNH